MDSPHGEDNDHFSPHVMHQPNSQDYGFPTTNEIDQPFLQDYNFPPPSEMDQPYGQDYGPLMNNEMAAPYGQEYGPPLQAEMNPPYRQDYYDPPTPDEITHPYWQDNGPPPPNESILSFRQNHGPHPPYEMEPPYGRDYGPPPPNEKDHPYRQNYGPPPSNGMDSLYRQDYDPQLPNETYQHYRQNYRSSIHKEMDLPYRQYQGHSQSNETDPQFTPDHDPLQYRDKSMSGHHEYNPSQQMNIHYQYPPDSNIAKEWSSNTGSELQAKTPSSPQTLDAALREVEVNLPRLTVLPSKGPAKPKGEECGLPNLGQTCYLSAVLQCLYHTLPLTYYLISQNFKEDTVKRSPSRGQVVRAAADILTEMDRGKPKKGTLAYFKGVCGRMDDLFASSGQREAHDLLSGLLTWLHQDLSSEDPVCACTKNSLKGQHVKEQTQPDRRILNQTNVNPGDHSQNNPSNYNDGRNQPRSTSSQSHPQSNNMQPPRTTNHQTFNTKSGTSSSLSRNVCKKCGLKPERRSKISDIFEGMHRATIICPESGAIICSIHERFWSLSLPLNSPGETPIEDALQQYYHTRAINWHCHYCRREHQCHRQMHILFLPEVLILHINRYNKKGGDPKLNWVTFPTEELTLDGHLTPGQKGRTRSKFSLYSICNHHGNKKRGHYTACCRSNHPQQVKTPWLFFDDEEVRPIERFKNPREAHILFYIGDVKDHQ